MKISVICPLYNSASYLEDMVESLKAQTMPDFEVIIVDDHSTDNSLNLIKQCTEGDDRFRFMQTPKNSGPGVARNIGVEAAIGQYICFIDSDDQYDADFLKKMSEAVSDGKDMAYCQLQYKRGKKDGLVHRNPVVPSGDFSRNSKIRFLLSFVTFSVCFIYKREFLQRNNLIFPQIYNSEDTNFLIKCVLLANTISCVDEPLYYYYVHPGSLTTHKGTQKCFERMKSMNMLVKDFRSMKKQTKYSQLGLSRFSAIVYFLWIKKGVTLSIIEFFKNIK